MLALYLRLSKNLITYWKHLLLAVFCMILLSLTTGALAYLIGPVMKYLFTNQGDGVLEIIPLNVLNNIDRTDLIVIIPVVIIITAFLKGISFIGQSYLMGYVGQRIVTDMRRELYNFLQSLSLAFYSKNPTGMLISRVTNDVNLLQTTVTDALASLMRDSFSIIVLAGVAVALDWKLAIVAFVVLPVAVLPIVKFGQRMRRVSAKGQTSVGSITTILHEAFAGVKIVKAFNMEEYEKKRFSEENWRLFKITMKGVVVRSVSPPVMEFLGISGLGITIWYSTYRIEAGTLTPEEFVSFFAAIFMLYQPLRRLSNVNNTIQRGLAAAKRIFDLIDSSESMKEKGGKEVLSGFDKKIEFSHVYFNYEDDMVLKDIDFSVKKGEIIAIVGMSGAGKSTLADLIPRFYDVSDGRILIDGMDIREFELKSLRSLISIVSQRTILFNDTVRNNIAYGDIEKDDEDIIRASKAANAHDFIMALPEGYDTVIGEQGGRLSGGERQRISIARALLKNSPILILDEATSSLDSESEREVQKALIRLMHGRTTFVIAHRLSTVREADRILVLSYGRIVESGKHEELVKRKGEYAKLYDMQFFERHSHSKTADYKQ